MIKHFFLVVFFCSLSQKNYSQPLEKFNAAGSLTKPWYPVTALIFSAEQTVVFDSMQINNFFKKFAALKKYAEQTRNFYRKKNYTYAWFQNAVLTGQANNLFARIKNLQSDGVYKKIPYQNAFDSLVRSNKANPKQTDLMLELMLTAQYFVFTNLAWQGMNTAASKSTKWYLPRKKVAYDQYLDSLLKAPPASLPSNEPVYRQYELLRKFLAKYRALDALNKWPPVISKQALKPGDSSYTVTLIKRRLYQLGDYQGDTLSNLFDSGLMNAVKQFQDRHGLSVDGLPGKEMIAALNVPLKARIKQILVNMERSRWLPPFLNSSYLAVNIPEFKLHVYEGNSLLWSCEVVVGKSMHQTAVFYGEIKYVVFSPYWNIPNSILRKEVLPGISRSSNYLASHNMEITGHEGGLPVVRQKPGPNNALGLVKFLFPNSYDIYLHDTPSKSLFGETSRAFSHGCIRVVEPFKLATFLLKNYPGWDTAKINTAMHLGVEQSVTLNNKVPVFIAYLTAFTDRNDRLNFRKDIYRLDEPLAKMIMSGNAVY